MHLAPGNQGLILLNISRTHREANLKVSPRIRSHSKRPPGPTETTTSGSSSGKCYTLIHQGRGEHKWSTPPSIWSNWKFYSDLTGKFPVQSERGNNYILVAYHYDANNIFTTTLKHRTWPCILSGITKIHNKLRKRGLTPKLHIMDNEVSEDLKKYVEDSYIQFQLVAPHIHRKNAVERAMRNLKNHFIASICTVDPISPLYLYNRLFPQVSMTLNMLRRSRLNSGISAY